MSNPAGFADWVAACVAACFLVCCSPPRLLPDRSMNGCVAQLGLAARASPVAPARLVLMGQSPSLWVHGSKQGWMLVQAGWSATRTTLGADRAPCRHSMHAKVKAEIDRLRRAAFRNARTQSTNQASTATCEKRPSQHESAAAPV